MQDPTDKKQTRKTWCFGIVTLFVAFLSGCSFNLDVGGSAKKVIPAKAMRITRQPMAVYVAGEIFAPELEVSYFDESGNIDPKANQTVSVALENNPASASLGGTLSADPVSGVTTFNNLKITKAGSGYTLKFTNPNGISDISASFQIVAAAPIHLGITSAPLSFHANECSATPLQYDVADQFGNTAFLTGNLTVNLSGSDLQFFSDASCTTPITSQVLSTGASGGQFYVSSSVAGSHLLSLSGAGMTSDNQAVTVLAASVGKLAFLSSSQTLVAGACSAAATIQSQDLFNNPNTVAVDTTIDLSGSGVTFYQDSACSGATVTQALIPTGTGSVTFYFKGTVAGAIPITGASAGFVSATQAETIQSDVGVSLAFSVQPSNTVAGATMSPAVEVKLLDQFGNVAVSTTKTVTLDIANNPSATATIVGGNRVKTTVNGVAVFNAAQGVAIQKADVGYTLRASAPGLTSAISNAFDITGAKIATLEYTTASQTLKAGVCSSVVNIVGKDQYGNLARASANTVLALSGTGLSFFSDATCSTSIPNATIGAGLNSVNFYFNGTVAGNPIVKTATVSSGDSASAISQNHIIKAGDPQSVTFTSATQTTEAGTCSGKVEIKVGDIYGNPVPPVADVSLSLSASDGVTVFYSDASCTAGHEITAALLASGANYGDFYYKTTKSGTNTITVSGNADFGSGNTAVTGSQINTVFASTPDHLEFLTQPPLNTLAGVSFAQPVQVGVKDVYGNICPSYSTPITVNLQNNPPGTAVIEGGAKMVTPVSGIATYSVANDIVIRKAANGYSLGASSGSFSSIESSNFNIVAGPATKYRYTATPVNTKAGYCSASAVTIQTEDSYGNISSVSGAKAVTYSATPTGVGTIQFFSDASCSSAAPANIADATNTISFYFKGTIAGNNTITIQPSGMSCDTSTGCATANSQSLTMSPDEPFALSFATAPIVSPNQVEAGSCSPAITLNSVDQFGNTVNVSADQVIQLTASTGSMYSDSNCATTINNGINPLKISSGSSEASFYFMTTVTAGGQHTSTAQSTFSGVYAGGTTSPNTSVVAQVNAIKAAPPDHFQILQQPLNSVAGQPIVGPFTAELRDRFDNPASTSTAKAYVNIGSTSPPTLYGGAGLTAGPNTPTNPVGKNYFPSPAVQAFWSYAVAGQLIYSGGLALNIQKVGTYTLRLSALGIEYNSSTSESTNFNVVNAPATKLAFLSSAYTQVAGTCSGAVSVQSQDPYSNSATVSVDTTITPSGTGMTFYSDSGCSSPVTNVTIANGTNSATFYYKGTTSGTQALTVQATAGASLTQASQNQTINPDVPKSLVYFTAARTTSAGACSSVVTVYSHDQFGNNSPVAADSTINFSQVGTPPASTLQFYSDGTCATSISSTKIVTGSYSSSFYSKGTVMGSIVLRVTPDFDVTGYAEQTETITAAALSQIAFISNGSQVLTAGDCSALTTFELRDTYGNAKNGAPTTVTLNTSQAGFTFYSDPTCSTVIDPAVGITVGAGTAQGSFYFKSTVSGQRNIVATVASPSVTQSATQSIDPAGFTRFAFTNGTNTISTLGLNAGVCSPVNVQAQDEFGNIVDANLTSQRVIIEASTANVQFYANAGCASGDELPYSAPGDTPPNKQYVTIAAAKEVQFYLRSTVKETSTLTASYPGVTYPGSLALTINASTPVKLAFATNLIQSTAGLPLQMNGPTTVKVQVLDQYNNVTTSTATIAVDMEPTNPNNTSVTLNGTKSLAAVAGAADFTTINITKAGANYSITATSAGLTSVTSNLFDVVASGPKQLTISSPSHTVVAGQCSPASTATLLDQYGNTTVASGDLAIDLSGTNMTFYSDASCTTPLSGSQLVILDGQSSGNFYYMPVQSGPISITAVRTPAPALSAGSQTQTVVAGPPSKIGFGNSARTDLVAGVCAGAAKVVAVELQDQFGNRATNTSGSALTVTMTGLGAQTHLYSDSSCSMEISKSGGDYQTSIANNGQYFNLYIQDSEAHSFPLTATVSEQPWTNVQTETVLAGTASKLAFVSAPQSGVVAGVCSSVVSFQVQDSLGNAAPVATNTTIGFASDGSVYYYSDSGCSTPISNASILAGTTTGMLYFKTTLAGTHDITVSASGLTSAMQTETVTFAAVNKLGFSQQPGNTVAGNVMTPAIRVDALDQYGNIVTTFTGSIDIAKGATPAGGTLSGTLTSAAVAGRASFADLSIEKTNTNYTLNASSPGLIAATSNSFNILSNVPAELFFVSAEQTMDVKNCSAGASIGVKDTFGNTTTAVSPITVTLTGDSVAFYSDSSCSTAITSSTILAGQGQTQFWFKPSKAGSIVVSGTSAGLTTANQTETVAPGVPAKLAIATPAQTVRSGECSAATTLQVQDAYGNGTPAVTNISANLLGSNYVFYSDASCSTVATSLSIGVGATSSQFWFKGDALGTTTIMAVASGLAPNATQDEEIIPGYAARFAFTSPPQNLLTNECSALTTFKVQDINGNDTMVTAPVDVDLTPTLGLLFYSDATCSTLINTVTINPDTPSAGKSDGAFYFKTGSVAGTAKTKVEVYSTSSVDADRFKNAGGPATLSHLVTARAPSKIAILGNGQTLRVSTCSAAVTMQTQDSFGNGSPVTAATVLSLSANHTVNYYSDSNCTNLISPANLLLGAGQSSASFYFKSFDSSTVTISVAATVEGSPATDSKDFIITPASAAKLVFKTNPLDYSPAIKVDSCYGVYTTELHDRFDNVVAADVDYDLVLSSASARFYKDSNCSDEISAYPPMRDRVLQIKTGETGLSPFYMKTLVTGADITVLSSNAGLENALHSFVAFPAVASKLAFTTNPQTVVAGKCSGYFEIKSTDHLGYETGTTGGLNVPLAFYPEPAAVDVAAGNYLFYSDASCATPVTSANIPDGQTRAKVYFRVKKAGTFGIKISATDTVSIPNIVFPDVVQNESIVPDIAVRFSFVLAPTKVPTNICTSAFAGNFYDSYSNVVNFGNTQDPLAILSSSSGGDLTFYSDANCTSQIIGKFNVNNMQPFYFKKATPGTITVSAATNFGPRTDQIVEVTDSDIDKVEFITAAHRVGFEFCSPATTIQLQQANGTPKTVTDSAGLSVGLYGILTNFYSSSDCNAGSLIKSANIPQGSDSVTFYYKVTHDVYSPSLPSLLITNQINLIASGLAVSSQTYELLHMTSAAPMNIGDLPHAALLNDCVAVGSLYSPGLFAYDLELSVTGSSNIDVYSDNACTTPFSNPTTLAINQFPYASFPFYIKANALGAGSYTYSEPHLNSASVSVDVKDLQIKVGTTSPLILAAGVCQPMTVQAMDFTGSPWNVTGTDLTVAIDLKGHSGNGFYFQMYSDPSCTVLTNNTVIPVGQSQNTIYLKGTVAPDSGQLTTSVSNNRFLNITKDVNVQPGAPGKLVLDSEVFDSVLMGQCSPVMRFRATDTNGNLTRITGGATINLSAQDLDVYGFPSGNTKTGVVYYSDASCTTPTATATVYPGDAVSSDFYVKTSFGREQFAIIANSSIANTYLIMSSAIDRLAFSGLPTAPSQDVYACRAFSVRHQQVANGEAIDPEKTIQITLESIYGNGNSNPFITFYRTPDCSGNGSNSIKDTITPLTGSPSQAEIEVNVTRTYYMISKTMAPARLRVSSPGRASSDILVSSTAPAGSKISFRDGLPNIQAGVCSGAQQYQYMDQNRTIIYNGRVEVGVRTSDASGARTIFGGANTSVDLLSTNLKFYSDPNCTNQITSIPISPDKDISSKFFFKSTKAGPNEASALGQITSEITGLSGRVFYNVIPGPVYQIGFGSDPQTIRAGDCSGDLVLQVQDQYGNEQSDSVENEVSFLYPTGLTLYSDATCSTNFATTRIPANQSRKTVWFRHSVAELATISPLPVRQLQAVPQTEKILSGSASFLRFTNAPLTVPKGLCSGVVTVQIQDAGGNPVNASADTVVGLTGESGSGMVFFSGSDCNKASEMTSVTISSGTSSQDFYFIGFKQGANLITAKNPDLVDAKQNQTIVAGLPIKLAFTQPAQTLYAGACSSAVDIFVADAYGTQSSAAANTVLSLSGQSATFYSDRNCTSPIVSLNLNAGDQTKTFYYKRTLAGDFDLTVSDTTLGTLAPAVQVQTIKPMIMSGTIFLSDPVTLPVGRCSPLAKVGVVDKYGNETTITPRSSLLITMAASNVQFYVDQQCSVALPGNQINMPENSSAAQFYFIASQVGTGTISVANNKNLDTTSQVETFTAGAASALDFQTPVRTVAAGGCSQVITVFAKDDYGFETNAGQNYTLNLTPPAGGQFYSSASCTAGTEIATTTLATGTSRANIYLKVPASTGTVSISVAASGLTSHSQNVVITGAAPSSLVFISSAQSGVVVETCSAQVTFGFQDAYANTAVASGNTTVNLSSAAALFYSDVGCTSQITSVTVPNAQGTGKFYFKPIQVGNVVTDISAAGLTGASQSQNATAGSVSKLVFSSAPQTFTAGTCRPATLQTQDALNNPSAVPADRTISLASSGSPATFYASSDCSGPSTTTLTQLSGTSSVSFSFMITVSGTSNFTGSSSGVAQALQTQTINPATPTKLAFATSQRTAVAGACSLNITVQSQDVYSNPSPLASTKTVSLAGSPLVFYTDSGCNTPASSVDIVSGTHSATFYFKSTTAGLWTITASGGGLTSGTQQQTVNSETPSKLAYINSSLTVAAGTCSLLSMQFQDIYSNPSNVSSAQTISYQTSGVPGSVYSDAGCTASITSQVLSSGNSFNAYFKSTNAGLVTVRISASGISYADQTETIQAGVPSKIAFTTSALTVGSNQCSGVVGPITVQVQDALSNPSGLTSAGTFTLSGSGYTFYSDAGCTTSVSSLPVGIGAHTASFYFKKTIAGSSAVTVGMTGFISVNQSQTINPLAVSKVGMSTSTQTIPSATCSAVVVQTQDANNNPVARGSATTVNLTVLSGSLSIYSDSGCTTPITSVALTGATSDAPTIYVKSNTSGTAVLQASDNGGILNNGSQTITVSSGAATAIAFATGTLNTTAGVCSGVVTVQARDSYGNGTAVAADRTVNLTPTPAVVPSTDGILFYSDASCSAQVTSVVILSGNQSANFYYKAFRANTYSVSAATSGFTTVSQNQNVVAGTMSSVAVSSGGNQVSVLSGSCSAMVQITGKDTYGNAAKPASTAVFNLTGTNLSFFSDSGCSSPITSVTIPTSGTTANFYYRSTVAGAYTININGPYSTTTTTTIVPGVPSVLEIATPITAMHTGACSTAITVRTKDLYGQYSSLNSSEDIVLATTPNLGQLYTDFGCINALAGNKVTVSAGTSMSQNFYFKDTTAETVSVNANLAGFTDGNASITVSASGPMINIYDYPAAQQYPSGSSYDFGLATVDTEKSFYIKNDGTSVSGVINVQFIEDLVNPLGTGSATMWAVSADLCTGQTLNAGASCLVTIRFKAQTGSKPSGDYYYSNMHIQGAAVSGGAGTVDLRLFGIKQ